MADPREWSVDDVAKWCADSGFAKYKPCFENNFVDGKRLQTVDASTLVQLGCRDFDDVKQLAAAIRRLFGHGASRFTDSIADQPWSPQRVLHGCVQGHGQPL